MKKTLFIFGISLLIICGCTQGAQENKEDGSNGFTFAFLTDIHLQPELGAVEGYRKAIDTINTLNPDFVLTGGDLVMDVLNQTYGRSDSLYKLYKKETGRLHMPVYNTIGNHEEYGWNRKEAGLEDHPEFGKKMYENRIGKRYYSFDHKDWHFMVLDAVYRSEGGDYIGRIDDAQIEWIKEDLQKTGKETPIAVSVHIPFVTSHTQLTRGALVPNPQYLIINNAREVLLNFWGHNLKLVLQGHLHYLEDINVNNQVHFITGGAVCGQWWKSKPESTPEEGFLLVHVNGEDFKWEYIDYGWVPPGQ